MSWARLEDTFYENPKILALTDKQFRLYVTAITYSAHYLTDGFISDKALRALGITCQLDRPKSVANALANSELFHSERGGYRINDYLVYNPSKAVVQAKREATRDRVKRHRNGVTGRVSNSVSNGPSRTPLFNKKEVKTSNGVTSDSVRAWYEATGVHVPEPDQVRYLAADLKLSEGEAATFLTAFRQSKGAQ